MVNIHAKHYHFIITFPSCCWFVFVVDLLCFKCLSVPVAASLIGGEAAADVADAVENFLPLEDDGMDQEPEEHVDRHQVSLLLVSVQLGHVLFCLMDPFRATHLISLRCKNHF